MLKLNTAALLQKEMDRKDFLKNVGFSIIALTGVAATLKTLSQFGSAGKSKAAGYGASAYGGSREA